MLNRNQAKAIAAQHIRDLSPGLVDVVIVDRLTVEKPYGWVFHYDSKRYVETLDDRYALWGNGPVLVESNGTVHQIGSAQGAAEKYLNELERRMSQG
jgi:hypothetical protein